MRIHVPAERSLDRGVDASLEALDAIFRTSWRDRQDEVVNIIGGLRKDGALLKWFLNRTARRAAWPSLTGAQSFTLFSTDTTMARINLWFPVPGDASESYRRYLSIEEIHNHDFDFFTTCLHGPGYTSTFWTDPDFNEHRRKGDLVSLDDEQKCRLHGDAVWFVDASSDFHAQHSPDAFTVTLNVLPNWLERRTSIQYVLDTDHRVKTVIDSRQETGLAA